MQLSVKDDVFIGDQTQVEVRMLTVVGGYFVTLVPLGDRALGRNTIPMDRVTLPYSLIRTLSDATKVTDQVAPRPINESLNQLQQGLTGSNTEVLAKLLQAGNAVSEVMERQRGQLTSILNVSNEYIEQLNGNRELLEYIDFARGDPRGNTGALRQGVRRGDRGPGSDHATARPGRALVHESPAGLPGQGARNPR